MYFCSRGYLLIFFILFYEFNYEACRVELNIFLLIYFLYRLWDILCLLYDVTYPTWIALCGINKVVKKKKKKSLLHLTLLLVTPVRSHSTWNSIEYINSACQHTICLSPHYEFLEKLRTACSAQSHLRVQRCIITFQIFQVTSTTHEQPVQRVTCNNTVSWGMSWHNEPFVEV